MSNWHEINRCSVWKVLGITECENCDTVEKCWGEEVYCVVDCQFCPYPCSYRDEEAKKELREGKQCLIVTSVTGDIQKPVESARQSKGKRKYW